MSTPEKRFQYFASEVELRGASRLVLDRLSVNRDGRGREMSRTYRVDPSALIIRQRYEFTITRQGSESLQELPSSAVYCADDIFIGEPLDSTQGDALVSAVDASLLGRYPDHLSSAAAVRRKVYLIVAAWLGLVELSADNTFTFNDPPV